MTMMNTHHIDALDTSHKMLSFFRPFFSLSLSLFSCLPIANLLTLFNLIKFTQHKFKWLELRGTASTFLALYSDDTMPIFGQFNFRTDRDRIKKKKKRELLIKSCTQDILSFFLLLALYVEKCVSFKIWVVSSSSMFSVLSILLYRCLRCLHHCCCSHCVREFNLEHYFSKGL